MYKSFLNIIIVVFVQIFNIIHKMFVEFCIILWYNDLKAIILLLVLFRSIKSLIFL